MNFLERFRKLNLSGTFSNAAKWSREKFFPSVKNILPYVKNKFTAIRSNLKENFPRNLPEFKKLISQTVQDKVQAIQSGEFLNDLKKASSGSTATYLRLGATAFAAYFLADTVSLFTASLVPEPPIVPPPPITRKEEKRLMIDEFASIVSRNIFNSKGLIPEENPDLANGPARKTSLPLNLIGTVILKNELKSIATIEDKSQNLVFPVRVDDTINDKIKVTKIEHLKVYFINKSTGFLEYVEIIEDFPQLTTQAARPTGGARPAQKVAEGIVKKDENSFEIERNTINKAVENLSQVLQEARAIPFFENGLPQGYKILQITPGSLYEKLGIQNNDVIKELNGEPINDPGKAFQLFNDLKTTSHVEIAINRNGKKMVLNYDINK